jgi:[acyl-carrier-protein] S-malonyltransferase
MTQYTKKAFIFPGQGAQYPLMGKDFYDNFSIAKETFEEADEALGRYLSRIIFEGPEDQLTRTDNSQVAIYVTSIAIWRVLKELHPDFEPQVTSGLSLGEYTALTVSGRLSFRETLPIVQKRGELMGQACDKTEGTMAVVLGLSAEQIEEVVKEVNLPNDLWAANFNCPGQVVLSGTTEGIEVGSVAAKAKGAKRVLPLPVHGAFHSGLMESAKEGLAPFIDEASIADSKVEFVMNVPGDFVTDPKEIKKNLIDQVTQSVRWEQGVRAMKQSGVDLFVEIGCGKTLTGFNKRIKVDVPTVSIEKVEDLEGMLV